MSRHVASVAGRLSLRPPQRESLEALDRLCAAVPPRKGTDPAAALAAAKTLFPSVTDFEREFPSVCFALATGVGKTRLMGAFVAYLYLAHGVRNFFVLAPNLTVYNKLVADFTPNTPKYVFRGVQDFAIAPPAIITGDNYASQAGSLYDRPDDCKINIFNIQRINSEVRGGKAPRIKRLSEYIGESYFDYLSKLPDLVLLMDESHRYRASAGVRAINELRPVLGLKLTATPFVESARGPVWFKNVAVDYPLAKALADGFVKEPAVVTRKDFDPSGMSADDLERLKLEDGVRLHERVKVELETYARQTGRQAVKPFVLVIARDTTHAATLLALVESDGFFGGRYKGRAIQVDSSKTGKEEDEMVERLLRVEDAKEPTEVVIHVNMLKEGWDVTNLYTIVPLRAANARTLIEQSIGRGLRLPYGERSGLFETTEDGERAAHAVDRLSIVAHDKFQEIVEEARRPDSPIRLRRLVVDGAELERKTVTVVSPSLVEESLAAAAVPGSAVRPLFEDAPSREAARATMEAIDELSKRPDLLPTVASLTTPAIRERLTEAVRSRLTPQQAELFADGTALADVVARTTYRVALGTIDVPRISVVPRGEVRSGFRAFEPDLSSVRYPPPSDELVSRELSTGGQVRIGLGTGSAEEERPEDYVVAGLVDFDDVSYDDNAELLNELAAKTAAHLRGYLKDEEAVGRVLRAHGKEIANLLHAQMSEHYWEEAAGYEVRVNRGFTPLRPSAYTSDAGEAVRDFRDPPPDKSKIGQYLYAGFARCLYRLTKFQSDTERVLAAILDRGSKRWFRPAKGQFQIYYTVGRDQREYVPDFVAETSDAVLMLESKRRSEMDDADVKAKRDAGVLWCRRATEYLRPLGGKPWVYLLVPHDAVAENMTPEGLAERFGQS